MINKNIMNAVLNSATQQNKDIVLKELLNHVAVNYDYNDSRAGHILEMLCDNKAIIKTEDININYINSNLNLIRHDYDKYNFKNIKIDYVDNIDCVVRITYDYIEKINEDRGDISYHNSYSYINFIDNPNILKK
jgi:hypothetical protein